MRFALAVLVVFLSVADSAAARECDLERSSALDRHAIHIDSDGTGMCRDAADELITDKDKFREHARWMLGQIRARAEAHPQDRTRILLYVHGALNVLDESSENARELARAIAADPNESTRTYPVSINWNASLPSAYWDHLLYTRQGKQVGLWRGIWTAPFVAAEDVFGVLGAAPRSWLYQVTIPGGARTGIGSARAVQQRHREWRERYVASPGDTLRIATQPDEQDVSQGRDSTWLRSAWQIPLAIVSTPVRLVIGPIVTSFGESAWTNFQRRTFNMFRRPRDLSNPRPGEDEVQSGALAVFVDLLIEELGGSGSREERFERIRERYEIVLIGHSTGAIVLNSLVALYPDLPYSRIVYMAPACSIQGALTSVIPYLASNPESRFSVLTLAFESERLEQSCFGLCSDGSLLEWIDAYFSSPVQELDRVLGKWENAVRYASVFPRRVRPQITLKKFGWRQPGVPQTHGAFNDYPSEPSRGGFWSDAFGNVQDPSAVAAQAME